MRTAWCVALSLVALFALAVSVQAKDKDDADKEVTLKGKLVCGKCTLKKCDECTNVLVVEKDGKKTYYYLKDEGKSEKYHKKICPPGKSTKVKITGTVKEEDGKQWLTVKGEVKEDTDE
jgi:hypothetical protein